MMNYNLSTDVKLFIELVDMGLELVCFVTDKDRGYNFDVCKIKNKGDEYEFTSRGICYLSLSKTSLTKSKIKKIFDEYDIYFIIPQMIKSPALEDSSKFDLSQIWIYKRAGIVAFIIYSIIFITPILQAIQQGDSLRDFIQTYYSTYIMLGGTFFIFYLFDKFMFKLNKKK